MNKILINILILFFIFNCSACAKNYLPEKNISRIIDDINIQFNKIDFYSADFEIEPGNDIIKRGKVYYKKPDLVRFNHLSNDGSEIEGILLYSESEKWWYVPKGNIAIKWPRTRFENSLKNRIIIDSGISEYKNIHYIGENKLSGQECYTFAIKDQKGRLTTEIYFEKERGIILKINHFDEDGYIEMAQCFSNFDMKTPVDDSIFFFEPPEGVIVNDMTYQKGNLMKVRGKFKGSKP